MTDPGCRQLVELLPVGEALLRGLSVPLRKEDAGALVIRVRLAHALRDHRTVGDFEEKALGRHAEPELSRLNARRRP
jgi:hypothetical protein